MSAPSATERVRRLQESGYISGFHAQLEAETLGHRTLGFVAVSIREMPEQEQLLEHVRQIAEVQECHVVAGEYDYLLKVRCASPETLAELLRECVRNLPGVMQTNTIMVLQTIKESGKLPVPAPLEDG